MRVKRTVKLEADELPHFGSESQIPAPDTVVRELFKVEVLVEKTAEAVALCQ